MGYFGRGDEKVGGPPTTCEAAKGCPFGFDRGQDRDIEGMPFMHGDPRSCPIYGHICPEFMEDFGLNEQELGLRGMIHRVNVIFSLVDSGELSRGSPEYRQLVESYENIMASQKKKGGNR